MGSDFNDMFEDDQQSSLDEAFQNGLAEGKKKKYTELICIDTTNFV